MLGFCAHLATVSQGRWKRQHGPEANTQLTTPKRRVVNGRLGEPGSREPSSAQLNERNDWCCVEHEATGCSEYKVRSSVIIFDQTPRAVAIRSGAGSRRGNSLIRTSLEPGIIVGVVGFAALVEVLASLWR
jgi:hypothetical protein